ncbi:bifunctional hydroxymethylpyrimidine kinase/phosphomethylpyrimidine kinase [Neisseriaceae bacterium ESL0693]|nr:bifunctional hydroxymethylpyrimidine kinase/phosphomethylpyrimidine kinase [Neisseriaceae bacterium ESL0693]
MHQIKPFPRVLTIAGSDSGGGAGIQADLKTFAALKAYGASVITAITAQNTLGVQQISVTPHALIEAQCDSVLSDIHIDAVKIGMLADVASIEAVARALSRYRIPFIVLDPVMVATSGDRLATEETVEALRQTLLPLAQVLTPNLFELAVLTDQPVAVNEAQMLAQGQWLLQHGYQGALLLKGGHLYESDESADWLLEPAKEPVCFRQKRIQTENTHGTGCTLSSAIAALRPQHDSLAQTVAAAKAYVHGAIEAGQDWQLGHGHGPLAHFWQTTS